jgi:hypothetical protein
MTDLFDDTDEFDQLVKEAAGDGTLTTREQGDRYWRLLNDAVQAHRGWAEVEQAAVIAQGAQKRIVRQMKRLGIVQASTRKGKATMPISTVIGVRDGGRWAQRPAGTVAPAQLITYIATKVKARDRSTERLEPWRRLKAEVEKFPDAPTVDEALALAGTTLVEVMERAS